MAGGEPGPNFAAKLGLSSGAARTRTAETGADSWREPGGRRAQRIPGGKAEVTGARRALGKDAGKTSRTFASRGAEPSSAFSAPRRGAVWEGAVRRRGSLGCGAPQLLLLAAAGARSWARGREQGPERAQEPGPLPLLGPPGHLLRAFAFTTRPTPRVGPSQLLLSAPLNAPCSDLLDSAWASRDGGIRLNASPAPGGPRPRGC